jgi:hypothetical protein
MNNKLSSARIRLMLRLALCLSLGCTSAKQGPSTAQGGAGGTAGHPSYVLDAGSPTDATDGVDAAACPVPEPGCYGCRFPDGLVGTWFAWQLQDCEVQFPVQEGYLGDEVYLVIDCVVHGFTGPDAGLMWDIGPAYEVDAGLYAPARVVPVTLTLSGEACDLIRANSNARIDVYARLCPACPYL